MMRRHFIFNSKRSYYFFVSFPQRDKMPHFDSRKLVIAFVVLGSVRSANLPQTASEEIKEECK